MYIRGHWLTLTRHTKWTADRIDHGSEEVLKRCEGVQYPVDIDYFLNVCLMDQIRPQTSCVNVCYTMFEADRCPRLWVEAAKNLDLILVPSNWNRDTFIESGIDANKVMVCPLGVNTSIHNPGVLPLAMVTDRGKVVADFKHRFLCVQELVSRKNVPGLLRTWVRAIRKEDNACLILKLGSHSGDKLGRFRERFLKDLSDEEQELLRETVLIYTRILPEQYMPSLYNACTHYITMSCGEGWGLPESKAGVMGKYLIAPDHSGLSHYVKEDNAYVLPWKREPADQEGPTRRLYDGANWFRPDEEAAVEQIRKSIEDANNEDRTKPDNLRELIVTQFSTGRSTEGLLSCLQEYGSYGKSGAVLPYKRSETFKNFSMYVKTMGTRCGIANYAQSLFAHILYQHQEIAKRGTGILCGNKDNALLDLMDRNSLEVVHLQLEYQFITEQRLKHLLLQLRARRIKSVVTMHTLHPKTGGFNHIVAKYADAVVVSSKFMEGQMQRLSDPRRFGHILRTIPMGCSVQQQKFSQAEPYDGKRPYRLGFFGFAYFHKGIDMLLFTVKSMQQLFGTDAVSLDIYSVKPAQDAVGYFERCQDLQKFLNVGEAVTWNADYLDESKIVEELSKVDLLVLPYSEYGGIGISAAGRTALLAGVPLMLTNNSFFYDINNLETGSRLALTVEQPQDLPARMAKHIKAVRAKPELQGELVKEFTEARVKFFQEHSWGQVARQHLQLYDELCSVP